MLKISEFAKLAKTTRRTLIFYDEKGIFSPLETTENGYRYYKPDQLYQFEFISGLRQLGLSLEEIQQVLYESDSEKLDQTLQEYQVKIREDIQHLKTIDQLLEVRRSYQPSFQDLALYQPCLRRELGQEFWCSERSVDCQPEDIAKLYANFTAELGQLQRQVTSQTGFLTELALDNASHYMSAAFRFIKAKNCLGSQVLTKLEKPAGNYVTVKVDNTLEGILKGLKLMQELVKEQKLRICDFLWQLNADEDLIKNASSQYGILQYQIIEGEYDDVSL
ncbi:MerR family transcriptional regulator [Streptococcus troglodytae]|uniref:MerR family transcriptional regulator n=1 Tax=Streptococcus troglodytae TaxID=1111760 RepID=A0A1L7LK34_9STRE|nr:MerR family transcriptional regulator [Streptococcus troglodytae]BAQ24478.1 MerR family transcriptional regulator [Streptococcus troglodytae]